MCQTAHVWCIAFVRYAQLWCFSKYICMHYSLQKYNSSTFLTWNIRFPTSSQGSFCKTGPGHFKPQFGSHHRLRKIRGHVATTQETLASCRVSVLGDSAVTHFLYREGQPLTPPIRRDLPQCHLFHQWRAGRTPKAEESPSAFRTPSPWATMERPAHRHSTQAALSLPQRGSRRATRCHLWGCVRITTTESSAGPLTVCLEGWGDESRNLLHSGNCGWSGGDLP